ncbi:Pex28p KNAG_0E00530 [Huiozyma naganishii CBS 8797]|uniref:TECPR1-like DysF domain-containing protein n=1 Tax=Huiozyma naganishii (strain ATCC MYA-139 / BCRC 22969 / CBS 8797 / KCTC 17520 / NBRC 10181 / NCYC 3082 / Yp74L-3) TaxID=1071383 RepID=J7S7G3_HUIN7|nr:hypothetical protein KNAG_0E00530 [Kazachstania naganishii CBS 8797]CCK70321.1 hypothetical protein KNAG_0E00530 [Kazachstania naganishii CBS 8797]
MPSQWRQYVLRGSERLIAETTRDELVRHVAGSLVDVSVKQWASGWGRTSGDQEDQQGDHQGPGQDPDGSAGPASSTAPPLLDILLDRLIARMVPRELPEREKLVESVSPGGPDSPAISASVLASNMKRMGKQMEHLFAAQDRLVRVLTWRNETGTLVLLLALTVFCYNPMYLVLLPLLALLFGVVVPAYRERHPRELHVVPSRAQGRTLGKSLLKRVARASCGSAVHRKTVEEALLEDNANLQLLVNLRDFQNMGTTTLRLTDAINHFLTVTCAFHDERRTTLFFAGGITSYIILQLASKYVNWSLLVSAALWTLMLATHPRVRPRLHNAMKRIHHHPSQTNTEGSPGAGLHDVVVDDQPVTGHVEIFAIYREALVPGSYKFFLWSPNVFDPQDECRRAQQAPPGVRELEDVLPPDGWTFDANSTWVLDRDVARWSSEKSLQLQLDDEAFLRDTVFKRQRFTRRVIRLVE